MPSVHAASGDKDGLPVALLDAMGTGLPAVASDLPGINEAVVDGETGLLVPAGDVERLRTALLELADGRPPPARHGRGGGRAGDGLLGRGGRPAVPRGLLTGMLPSSARRRGSPDPDRGRPWPPPARPHDGSAAAVPRTRTRGPGNDDSSRVVVVATTQCKDDAVTKTADDLCITAVVVSFNRVAILGSVLDALARQTRPVDRVIVVDNASTDGAPELVREHYPSVDLFETGGNLGGAGGFASGWSSSLSLSAATARG